MLPAADAVGGVATAQFPASLIAKITGSCGAGCVTINKTPNASLAFASGYVFIPTTTLDGSYTWGVIPFASLAGVSDCRTSQVPGGITNPQAMFNCSSNLGATAIGAPSRTTNSISQIPLNEQTGPLRRSFNTSASVFNFPQAQNDLSQAFGLGDDLYLSLSADASLTAPAPTSGAAQTKRIWIASTSTPHTVTFDGAFAAAPPYTTDGVAGDEALFTFESDGPKGSLAQYRLSSGPTPQVLFASIDPSPVVGERMTIIDASACTIDVAVTAGGGTTHSCPTVWNGANWVAVVTH